MHLSGVGIDLGGLSIKAQHPHVALVVDWEVPKKFSPFCIGGFGSETMVVYQKRLQQTCVLLAVSARYHENTNILVLRMLPQ